jgi:RNA polymerase sigma-70 factor (sigma-E family)
VDAAEREDFRDFVVARSPALLRTAYLMTGSRADAEDLLQTSLAKAYLAWGRIRDREAREAYVRRTMANTATSWWRRKRLAQVPLESAPEPVATGTAPGARDLHDALWVALAGLPRRARAMVVLRYYEDMTEPEVAHLLGVSVGTVKSTVSRALARLREDSVALGLQSSDERLTLPGSEVTA